MEGLRSKYVEACARGGIPANKQIIKILDEAIAAGYVA